MALLASDVINDARAILIDTLGVRWPDAELIDWLNDAARQCVLLKPDSNPITEEFTCVLGAKQSLTGLTADLVMLFDVPNNTDGTEDSITFVKRNVMDSERPTWRNVTADATTLYYMYDDWQRDVFYVYPPATAGSTIDIVYAGAPVIVTALTDALPLQDIYGPALTNYVVWRAFSKDSDFSGNMNLAGGYYSAFVQALTGKIAADVRETPERNIPPNIAAEVG